IDDIMAVRRIKVEDLGEINVTRSYDYTGVHRILNKTKNKVI
ncbi:10584_t:CDS:2, partial [Gigaspora margarita]